MRRFYRVFTMFGQLLILVVLTANPVTAQTDFWEQTNGPFIGEITSLAISSTGDIFAGTIDDGVFRSSDNGDNWSQINTGLPDPEWVEALASFL